MTTDQLFYTLTAALVVVSAWTLIKSYIDKKDESIRRYIESTERWLTDDFNNHRVETLARFKDLDNRMNDVCPANKAMSKNYYNSANEKCCKKDFIQD